MIKSPDVDALDNMRQALSAWQNAEAQLIHAIMAARANGVTWQRIGDVFGHGDRAAAKRWYERRL